MIRWLQDRKIKQFQKGKGDFTMSGFSNYQERLNNDAEDFINNYIDEIIEEVKEGNFDLHDFCFYDGKLDEHVDEYLDLQEAVDIIENCNNEESDSGLWEGQQPEEALKTKAMFSYRLDVYEEVAEVLSDKLEEYASDLEDQVNGLEADKKVLEEELEDLEELDEEDQDEDRIEQLEEEISDIEEEIDELNEQISNIEDAM